jgi:protein-disulfide isomerase
MKPVRLAQAVALAASALFLGAAAHGNWAATVVETGTSHVIGNPQAEVKLVEYISYTCPHCAAFTRESEGVLQIAYITPGKVSVEVRHLIRDPVDLTVATLVHCGPAAKFPQNHAAFMLGQDKWIGPLARPTQTQMQRWRTPGAAGRRAIASDFGLYAIMQNRGYTRTNVDQCLANEAFVKQIADTSDRDWDRPGIDGTPSFAINGTVMPGTHAWSQLTRQLDEFIRAAS